jgi:hypothetical protein
MATRWLGCALILVGCGGGINGDDGPVGGSNTVSGTVVDFQSTMPVPGSVSVSTAGLFPAPTVTVTGTKFEMTGVPDNSAFQILASTTGYHPTYSPTVSVESSDVSDIQLPTASDAFVTALATGFSVTPAAGKGVLMLHLLDAQGTPRAGVAGSNLVLAGAAGASGPHFLDASLQPDKGTNASSASGWAVFFNVPPGSVSLGIAVNANVTLAMPTSPVADATVTLADVSVTDGAPMGMPMNVSFSRDVAPIFPKRGCTNCHAQNGIGKQLGNLTLDGGTDHVYKELVTETPYRVVVSAPETSKVLTMPSAETPPDAHPNITFTGPQDPDYVTILQWIREGAKNN